MIDNNKFLVENQTIMERLYYHPDFEVCKRQTNNYYSTSHKKYGSKLRLDFRIVRDKGEIVGYRHLEINSSPHYHKNKYQHNGDDFSHLEAIKSIKDILTYLNINESEYSELKVVNLEFGVNIIPTDEVKNIINGLYFHNRDKFIIPDQKHIYSKRSDTTKYKRIKVYAKGLQFSTNTEYGIHPNTLRFEIKSKESKYIKTQKIYTVLDLLDESKYQKLADTLLNEWEKVLVVNLHAKYKIEQSFKYWTGLINHENRNTFRDSKLKYYKVLSDSENIHLLIKQNINDKINKLLNNANSTMKTTIDTKFLKDGNTTTNKINVENAYLHRCIITGIDISTQKKGSKFLRESTLKMIKTNNPTLYEELSKKYLTDFGKLQNDDRKIYLICKNIRDIDSNKRNNRKKFESRYYSANQLQLNF